MEPNVPKYTSSTLDVRANYYVVEQDDQYHYFPVKIQEGTADLPIIRISARPPILKEGWIYVGRLLYAVSLQDLIRGIVRQSSKVVGSESNGKQRRIPRAKPPSATPSTKSGTSSHLDQSGSVHTAELEIDSAADLAWQEQAQSLLEALHQEEGGDWFIEDPTQS